MAFNLLCQHAFRPTIMKQGRVSQTALKVAHNLVALSAKDDWRRRLPEGLSEMSERLLVASGQPGMGPRMMRLSKGPWMVRAYKLQELLMPGQFEGFGYRKIYVQQKVEAAIEDGAKQVLFTGAGFDTLCLRLAPLYPSVQFIELDHPATSAVKAKGIALEGQPANMLQIAADLSETSLSKTLLRNRHWSPSLRSVIVAEGLFQYLTDQEVRELLVEAAACTSAGSRFVFTHAKPGYSKAVTFLTNLVAESWKSSVESQDLPSYVKDTGWEITSGVDMNEKHGVERYAVAERI